MELAHALAEVLSGASVVRIEARVSETHTRTKHVDAEALRRLLDAPGAGLAAPQIGVGLRLFVYDCADEAGTCSNVQVIVQCHSPTSTPAVVCTLHAQSLTQSTFNRLVSSPEQTP